MFTRFLPSISILSLVFSETAAAAPDATPFPTPPSKKGLQVQMVPDAIALSIHHAGVNVSLGALMGEPKAEEHPVNQAYLNSLEASVKPLSDAGVLVYMILLAYPTNQPAKDSLLLHPKAKPDKKYNIAAFNTATPEGIANYSALVETLAERFSGAHAEAGRVWGYIVGNEVNSQWMWYNLNRVPMEEVASEYEKAVRLTHDAVRKHSAHSRIYLSFDHHWNASMLGISDQEAYKGRDLLDTFATLARERGDFEWHVAHHPYPDDLGNPRTWLDKAAHPNEDSPHITFKNLEVACRYMEKPDLLWNGKPRRIILSEQGLHRLATPDGELLQAAGFAYAWEKIARQPLIDAFIWHRHVDHQMEGGLRLGLWSRKESSISDPERKLMVYDLMMKAGTPAWDEAAKFALPIAGLTNWNELAK